MTEPFSLSLKSRVSDACRIPRHSGGFHNNMRNIPSATAGAAGIHQPFLNTPGKGSWPLFLPWTHQELSCHHAQPVLTAVQGGVFFFCCYKIFHSVSTPTTGRSDSTQVTVELWLLLSSQGMVSKGTLFLLGNCKVNSYCKLRVGCDILPSQEVATSTSAVWDSK